LTGFAAIIVASAGDAFADGMLAFLCCFAHRCKPHHRRCTFVATVKYY
jgi:hypothetical protein